MLEHALSEKQLDAMQEVGELAESVGLKAYNWGGWIPDFCEGEVLRDHEDLDLFVIPTEPNKSLQDLEKSLSKYGWEARYLYTDTLEAVKDQVKAGLILLKREGETIVSETPDRPLRIEFPAEWLKEDQIELGGRTVNYTDPKLTYCMKVTAREKHAGAPTRQKDTDDIIALEHILASQGVTPEVALQEFKWINKSGS